MKKSSATKGAFLVLLFMMFFNGAAYADTISSLSLRINSGAVGVLIADNSASDTDVRSGYITFSGFVGAFFIGSASASTVVVGPDVILTLSSQVGHFGGVANQITLTAETTGTVAPVPVNLFLGNVNATMTGASGTFQSWLNGVSLFAGSGATLATGVASNSVGTHVPSPFVHNATATIAFPTAGGTANFTFTSIADPVPPAGTPLPEPLSMLLVGAGLVGVGVLHRKRGHTA